MGRPMFCSCWPGKVSAAMCLSNRASCIPEPRWESIKLKAFTTFSLSNLDQVLLPITEKWKYQYIHNVYLSNKQISAPLRNSVIWFRQVFHRMTLDVNMHLKPVTMVCVNGVRSLKNKLLDATSPTVSYTLCKQRWYKELSSFQFQWKKMDKDMIQGREYFEIRCQKSAKFNYYTTYSHFCFLTTEGCPLNSLSIVGGGEVFGIVTVIS